MGTQITSVTSQEVDWSASKAEGQRNQFWSKRGLERALIISAFGLLWMMLINELRIDWTTNPQYGYGWLVPVLAIGLLFRRFCILTNPGLTILNEPTDPVVHSRGAMAVLILCGIVILPLRFLLEAAPGWRTLNWMFACSVVGITLIALNYALGLRKTVYFAFPICFILVAVPWPFSIEVPLIQTLTRVDVSATIEVLGACGIPAMQHGNLIELSSGTVGVDEACSGIRSFQSSIMIALFMGEFYRLNLLRRLLLVPVGFLLAMAFNVVRTSILTWVAARKGMSAISDYHDPAGVSIMIACVLTLWVIAHLLRNTRTLAATESQPSTLNSRRSPTPKQWSFVRRLSIGLLVWLLLVEVGVEAWYQAHEMPLESRPQWSLVWPPRESGFQELPIPAVPRELLRYDEGHSGAWRTESGADLQMFYFRWLPGRLALSSARSHNPSVCLVAAGKQLRPVSDNRCPITIRSIVFPFRRYEYEENGEIFRVFHCLWEEHAPGLYFDHDSGMSQMESHLRAALDGRRNRGQRSLEFLVRQTEDAKSAEEVVKNQLQKLISLAQPDQSAKNARLLHD